VSTVPPTLLVVSTVPFVSIVPLVSTVPPTLLIVSTVPPTLQANADRQAQPAMMGG
jgi:hypothetical protein